MICNKDKNTQKCGWNFSTGVERFLTGRFAIFVLDALMGRENCPVADSDV